MSSRHAPLLSIVALSAALATLSRPTTQSEREGVIKDLAGVGVVLSPQALEPASLDKTLVLLQLLCDNAHARHAFASFNNETVNAVLNMEKARLIAYLSLL